MFKYEIQKSIGGHDPNAIKTKGGKHIVNAEMKGQGGGIKTMQEFAEFETVRQFEVEEQLINEEVSLTLMLQMRDSGLQVCHRLLMQVGDPAEDKWELVGIQYEHKGRTDNPDWNPTMTK